MKKKERQRVRGRLLSKRRTKNETEGFLLLVNIVLFFCRVTGADRSSPRGCDQQETVQLDCNGRNVHPVSFQFQMDKSSGFRDIFRSTGQSENSKNTRKIYFYPKIISLTIFLAHCSSWWLGWCHFFVRFIGMEESVESWEQGQSSTPAVGPRCGRKHDGWLQLLQRQKETEEMAEITSRTEGTSPFCVPLLPLLHRDGGQNRTQCLHLQLFATFKTVQNIFHAAGWLRF